MPARGLFELKVLPIGNGWYENAVQVNDRINRSQRPRLGDCLWFFLVHNVPILTNRLG